MNKETNFFTNDCVSSSRVIYTPSSFARTSLLFLQETGSLKAIRPHVLSRANLQSYLLLLITDGSGWIEYESKYYEMSKGDLALIDCKKGKIVCGNCNYNMVYNERKVMDSFYLCPCIFKTKQDFGCCRERIQESVINDLVFRQIKLWFQVLHQIDDMLKEEEQHRFDELQETAKEAEHVKKNLTGLQNRKVLLYEKYSEGNLSREAFISNRDELSSEIEGIRAQLDELHRKENSIRNGKRKRKGDFKELIQRVDIFKNELALTRTMTEAFLDKVIVYDKFQIEIRWVWQDIIADMGLIDEAEEILRGGEISEEMYTLESLRKQLIF